MRTLAFRLRFANIFLRSTYRKYSLGLRSESKQYNYTIRKLVT